MKNRSRCYFCGEASTSREHVPPKCLFPLNQRTNLFVVPSCDLHNCFKSDDDEYLKFVLSISIKNTNKEKKQILESVLRAAAKSPEKYKTFSNFSSRVTVKITNTGEIQEATKLIIDEKRFHNILTHISRAIFFIHYKKVFKGSVNIVYDGRLFDDIEKNRIANEQSILIHEQFKQIGYIGSNQKTFKYCIFNKEREYFLGLIFYTTYLVIVLLNEDA